MIPSIIASIGAEHQTTPLANQQIYGVPSLQSNTGQANVSYSQAFPTGTSVYFDFNNSRQTTNSPFFNLSPVLNSFYRFGFQQQLLAGFGFGPNLRYLLIAKNNKKISDMAFKDQVIATITQIKNIYWDLVDAYEQAQVNEQSLAFAQQSLDNAKKQFKLESIPAMDVMRAEAEVSKRDQDLTVARTSLQLQELLIKNALTRSLDDPVLEAVPVVPTDHLQPTETVKRLRMFSSLSPRRCRTALNCQSLMSIWSTVRSAAKLRGMLCCLHCRWSVSTEDRDWLGR